MKYRVKIDAKALEDIREIKSWYNSQKVGLGERFRNAVIKQINSLEEDPYIFAVRYREIRCMTVRNFPYMVHFYINIQSLSVEVLAVISTKRNPKIWNEKTGRI